MVQASKNRIIRLLKQWRYNMRGYSSFFIIITSKDSKHSFKNSVLDLNGIYQHSMISWNYPPAPLSGRFLSILIPPPPYIEPLPPLSNHPSPPCWYWDHNDNDRRCRRPQPLSSASADMEVSCGVINQEEVFVSYNYCEYCAWYIIHSAGF